MKKVISALSAVALLITLLTGCNAPLSKADYKKQTAKLIDEFFCATMFSDDLADEMSEYDLTEFDKKEMAEIKEMLEKYIKDGDQYLLALEKLNPPEEMADFHEDLLDCVAKVREYEEKFLAAFDAKSESKFESAMEKANSSFEKLGKKVQKLTEDEDNDWLVEALEDAKFMDSEIMTGTSGMVTKSRVTSADQTAKTLADSVNTWMSDLESTNGVIPSAETVIEISGHCSDPDSNGDAQDITCVTTGFKAANDSTGDKAKKKLQNYINDNYTFNKDITAIVIVKNRKVVGCAYSEDGVSVAALESQFNVDVFMSGSYAWNGKTDGIGGKGTGFEGKVIGTSPKLLMENNYY